MAEIAVTVDGVKYADHVRRALPPMLSLMIGGMALCAGGTRSTCS